MGRFARVIAVDIAHHVTQRGNARHFILDCDADREVYLHLLREDEPWRSQWTADDWQAYLASAATESEIAEIRRCTHTGRPLGTEEFVHSLELSSKRGLAPLKGGRPKKTVTEANQKVLEW